MDTNRLIARVKAILMTPKTEWPVIDTEPASVADLYKHYILILAAIPVVFAFIKGSLIGYGAFGIHVRTPFLAGIAGAIVGYVLSLVLVYVMALIIDALAPSFGGQKNPIQAFKVATYTYTASWIAGIGVIVPGLGWLIAIAGGIYGIYLLYLGLPVLMKAPQEKAAGYTAVSIIIAIVLGWIIGLIVATIGGAGAVMSGSLGNLQSSADNVTIDKDSALGHLQAFGERMEAAGKQMEAAQKSGDADAQSQALGAVLGAAMGGGQVEALAPDALKPFVPEQLGGLPRTGFSAERNGAMGMQISEATASYSDGGEHTLHLEIQDMGSAKGFLALAGFAALGNEKQTDHGYEKTWKQDGRLINEKWDSRDNSGEYGIVLGDRFMVKVTGNATSIDQLKAAVASIDLAGLEALKNQGVKQG